MKSLGASGINEFIIATGYKSDMIKEYFLSYEARSNDFTVKLGSPCSLIFHDVHDGADWTVTVAFTGTETMTGGPVKQAARYLTVDGPFLVTYGDGLADVDVAALCAFHAKSGTLGTVTTVQPWSRFGVMEVGESGAVTQFREKPQLDAWVNIGYFIFERDVLSYLDENTVLEAEALQTLAVDRQLAAYRHRGFWHTMDTYREAQMLNDMWSSGSSPWKVWYRKIAMTLEHDRRRRCQDQSRRKCERPPSASPERTATTGLQIHLAKYSSYWVIR